MNGVVEHFSERQPLRLLVVAAGIGTSILFVIVGLSAELQIFGDGSIFSYAVAAQDAWAFHWHNISGRLFSYIYAYVAAEAYVALMQDPWGGIFIYGLLLFSAPLLGLLGTLALDRTPGRVIFVYACSSTACLCPLVFGIPTEMWMAHALFWPALAACLSAPANARGIAVMFITLLALVFTHEGALVFSATILFSAFMRERRDKAFVLTIVAWSAAMVIWLIVKLTLRPDDYFAPVLAAAAFRFIDINNMKEPAFLLLCSALAGYGIAVVLLRRVSPTNAPTYAAIGCAAALAVYWVWFDTSLLAGARYKLRTTLLIATPVFGVFAALHATQPGARRKSQAWAELAEAIRKNTDPKLIAGAVLLTMLVHAVEVSKFVVGWTQYKAAIRSLATGTSSDSELGDARFVSSQRVGAQLSRLSWNSTTPYLSVLVAPGLRPGRLVVDPVANYFWLSCEAATRSESTSTAIPVASRELVRRYACLHR